jgi:hypothetical protein
MFDPRLNPVNPWVKPQKAGKLVFFRIKTIHFWELQILSSMPTLHSQVVVWETIPELFDLEKVSQVKSQILEIHSKI